MKEHRYLKTYIIMFTYFLYLDYIYNYLYIVDLQAYSFHTHIYVINEALY